MEQSAHRYKHICKYTRTHIPTPHIPIIFLWLLNSSAAWEELYARIALLLTPTTTRPQKLHGFEQAGGTIPNLTLMYKT